MKNLEVPAHNNDFANNSNNKIFSSPMSKEFGSEAKVAAAATLKDLCPEDKAKIGELIKKLAQEKEDKEGLSKEISDVKKNYESIIYNLQSTNNQILKESTDLQDQFRYSLNILKNFQVYITLRNG